MPINLRILHPERSLFSGVQSVKSYLIRSLNKCRVGIYLLKKLFGQFEFEEKTPYLNWRACFEMIAS